jgi:ATP-dependent DNA helicase RecG
MTAYADLDVSVLDELPPSRQPVRTTVMADNRREAIVERVAERCRAGGQAYWVCPLIEESEHLDSQAATDTANLLADQLAPLRVALIHGRMQEKDKQAVMLSFVAGEIDLLVATTVIEVGVDVPNASLMVIENAERLGLSQLHQLRGRVGRGAEQSYCILMSGYKLSKDSRTRIETMVRTNNGFEIADIDLKLRGPGDLFGTAQSGVPSMRVATLLDAPLIDAARREAETLLDEDPDLKRVDHQALKLAIASRTASVVAEMH